MFIPTPTRCVTPALIATLLCAAIAHGQDYSIAASHPDPGPARSTSGSYLAGTYAHDDGSSETAVGITCGAATCNDPDATLVWAQYFDTLSAAGLYADTITHYAVAFGHPPGPSAPPAGSSYELLIYDDPNDDGDPTDLTSDDLVLWGDNAVTSPDTDTLEPTEIVPVVVHRGFFLVCAMKHTMSTNPPSGNGQYPAALDRSQASLGRAWVAGSIPAANWSPFEPQSLQVQWAELDSIGLSGVWRLQAFGSGTAPSTFCTAKNGLACGTPAISSVGEPDITSTSGFVVRAGPARSCKTGLLLYNLTQAQFPLAFSGGTLCIDPMGIRRAGPVNSEGTPVPGHCDGEFQIDMNAFARSAWTVPDCAGFPAGIPQSAPASYLSTPGVQVNVQFWGRDTLATGSFLSDGLQYTVQASSYNDNCPNIKLEKKTITVTVCAEDAASALKAAKQDLRAGKCIGTCKDTKKTCKDVAITFTKGTAKPVEVTPTDPCLAPDKRWNVKFEYEGGEIDCDCVK
jgi:hypothetical protein